MLFMVVVVYPQTIKIDIWRAADISTIYIYVLKEGLKAKVLVLMVH